MKKSLQVLFIIAIIVFTAIATYLITMQSLQIETDGNGDSAFITALGIKWFYGINGFEI